MTNQELCTQYELIIELIESGNTERALKVLKKAVKRMEGSENKSNKKSDEKND